MRWNLTPEQRFWSKVDPCRTDGCAVWLGATQGAGYGVFWLDGSHILAHHFLVGKPPSGLVWDHVRERGCTHRECVWPDHLEAVTNHENLKRGTGNGSKTCCPQGHPYDEGNTYHYKGARICRACNRQSKRRTGAPK